MRREIEIVKKEMSPINKIIISTLIVTLIMSIIVIFLKKEEIVGLICGSLFMIGILIAIKYIINWSFSRMDKKNWKLHLIGLFILKYLTIAIILYFIVKYRLVPLMGFFGGFFAFVIGIGLAGFYDLLKGRKI